MNFQSITRSVTVDETVDDSAVIMQYIRSLLSKTEAGEKKVRLLGISVSNFDDQETHVVESHQLPLPLKFQNGEDPKSEFQLWY
jgi:DNA polymerase-4